MNDWMPAFPCGLESGHMEPLHMGMDLRDYFAAKAMNSFLFKQESADCNDHYHMGVIANASYAMADAMMKAREA